MAETPDIERLIAEWQAGSKAAQDALFAAIYRDLQCIAERILSRENPSQTLGATALVHEACVRLRTAKELNVNNPAHLLAFSALVMRRIVVDAARSRRRH